MGSSIMRMEKSVFFAFVVQALIIAGIFAFAICWFSFLRRYCQNRWLNSEDDNESITSQGSKNTKATDLPPTYSQADLFSQMGMNPTDVLYPPPSYQDLNLPAIEEEVHERECVTVPMATPIAAFTTPTRSAGNRRRNSAPPSMLEADEAIWTISGHSRRHRNSIAAISHNVLMMPISEHSTNDTGEDTTTNTNSLTSRWLVPILQRVKRLHQHSAPRRQTDHPYYDSHNRGNAEFAFDNRAMTPDVEFGNTAFEVTSDRDQSPGERRDSVEIQHQHVHEPDCSSTLEDLDGDGDNNESAGVSDVVTVATVHHQQRSPSPSS